MGRLHPVDESIADEVQGFVMQRRHRFLQRKRAFFARVLRGGAEHGEFSEGSIELLAIACQGALFNLTRTYALTPSRKSQAILAEAVDLLFRGIGRCR
jgi:hypothetical protein